jgi:hypothetical protein
MWGTSVSTFAESELYTVICELQGIKSLLSVRLGTMDEVQLIVR